MAFNEELIAATLDQQHDFQLAESEHAARAVAHQAVASQDYAGGRFEVNAKGVFYVGTDKDGAEAAPTFICAPLHIVAKTRDAKSGAWGRLLRWSDDDGVWHYWAMPLDLLQGDGADMRKELSRLGLAISPNKAARDLLSAYIQVWSVDDRARCVDRLGWYGPVYVTADETIGESCELVVFQNAHALQPALSQAGTVDEWVEAIGLLAAGNTRIVFALSIAFAGPLASIANVESGGFHLRGPSSTGKSTAQVAAASVWGSPQTYKRSWRATANGLEGLAALHNDGVLILDEISQIDSKEIGEAAYMLANGQGKARASQTGTAKQAFSWQLLFLSSGEESLASMMARAGKRPNAGQEIRLADIEADAGAGMGAFESLNDHVSAADLAQAINDNAQRFHGAVGIAFIRTIVADRAGLPKLLNEGIAEFVADVAPTGADSQVLRVARRFALVAVAGELATHYGLTGWQAQEAVQAAKVCFASWLEAFGGTTNRETRSILAQARAFFESHGSSRFEDINATHDQRIINRAGFYKTDDNGTRIYFVLPEAFKNEICKALDHKTVERTLLAKGWIKKGGDGRPTDKPNLPGMGRTRCYVFTSRMWEEE
ncbi:DUF927 domain-containing protein [Ralstonia nicotianae]|uniref:DUF927 domain-containing protein n=1 Tax=Ralstonia pseudosolanacearum TaxID=1310165 RepID=UPI00156E23AE|nr:DUF927 domain-containing protein [Ralstonia solanacearum]QKM23086.1 DUF927 domain-containing protein [Ralstonia solanacearum]QKM27894.1 DUF927 domain-containing protein [Ralstonia solanacearum]UZF18570.1 DUF927 domain-containing protein [Ralstonia solanacearum]